MNDKDKECRSQREAFEKFAEELMSKPLSSIRSDYTGEFLYMFLGFQAGAAWRQSRLLDEELVVRATNAAAEYLRDRSGLYTDECWEGLTKSILAEIKKHMEGV